MILAQPEQKASLRQQINAQISDYLSRGGEIAALPMNLSGEEFIPKRTRKQQVAWVRKRLRIVGDAGR